MLLHLQYATVILHRKCIPSPFFYIGSVYQARSFTQGVYTKYTTNVQVPDETRPSHQKIKHVLDPKSTVNNAVFNNDGSAYRRF